MFTFFRATEQTQMEKYHENMTQEHFSEHNIYPVRMKVNNINQQMVQHNLFIN